MSIKEEIQKLVNEEGIRLDNEEMAERKTECDTLAKSRRLIEEISPTLDELVNAVNDVDICVEFRENFAGTGDVTVIVCVGEVILTKDGSASDVGFGDGRWWSFWPCFAEDGRVSWSFCDGRSKHVWFDSVSDLFACLIPGVAEEIAKQQYEKATGRT